MSLHFYPFFSLSYYDQTPITFFYQKQIISDQNIWSHYRRPSKMGRSWSYINFWLGEFLKNGVEKFTSHLCLRFKQRPQAAMEATAATFDRYQRTELPAILHRHPRFEVATAVAIYGLLPGAQGWKRSQISIGNKPPGSSTFVPAESAKYVVPLPPLSRRLLYYTFITVE